MGDPCVGRPTAHSVRPLFEIPHVMLRFPVLCTRLLPLAVLLAAASASAQMTPADAAAQMGRGINLGNTMEADPTEGSWNNKELVQERYFDDYAAAGFSTVRIPVRWGTHMGNAAPFAVSAAWMDRVEQVVDWALERGLFVILNSHHDDWLKRDYSNPRLQARFDSLWSQVATRFQDKPDRLLFEMFNEPFSPMTLAQTEDMNARVLPIIRRTNPTRIVLYSGASYSSRPDLISAQVPADDYVMGYYHSYDPFLFGLRGQGTWGTASDRRDLDNAFSSVVAWSARTGVPAALSEFGAIKHTLQGTEGNTITGDIDYNSRMRFYGAFVVGAVQAGIPFQAWDDGGDFEIFQRASSDWNEIKDILISTFPDGPNRFAATARDSLAVLAWDAPGPGIAAQVVERRFGDEAFATVAEVAASATSYTDTLRAPGTYDYRVVARATGGPDRLSYPQRVTILPTRRAPFAGTPVALPSAIEAENYDVGGEGLTYHDTDAANIPGAYRPDEGVDIEARTGGGFQVARIAAGEWLEYTVTVPDTDRYTVTAYVASPDGGATFTVGGPASRTNTLTAPPTGSFQTLAPVSGTMRLGGGEQTLRFQVSDGNVAPFTLDRIVVERFGTALEDDRQPATEMQLFPNPARQRLTVAGVAAVPGRRVEVYDALGKRVLDVALTQENQTLALDGLAVGAYVLRVVGDGATLAQRPFVIVR